jgi:hypothetical protein
MWGGLLIVDLDLFPKRVSCKKVGWHLSSYESGTKMLKNDRKSSLASIRALKYVAKWDVIEDDF